MIPSDEWDNTDNLFIIIITTFITELQCREHPVGPHGFSDQVKILTSMFLDWMHHTQALPLSCLGKLCLYLSTQQPHIWETSGLLPLLRCPISKQDFLPFSSVSHRPVSHLHFLDCYCSTSGTLHLISGLLLQLPPNFPRRQSYLTPTPFITFS